MTVYFTYYDADPNVKKTVTKTIDGSTEAGAAATGVSGKRLTFNIPGFEFHNSNQIVIDTVTYEGEVIASVNYSIETYLASQLSSTSTASDAAKNLATAIAKFGLAFRNNKGITA